MPQEEIGIAYSQYPTNGKFNSLQKRLIKTLLRTLVVIVLEC